MNGTVSASLGPQASPAFYNHELLSKITADIGREVAPFSINWVLNSLYHKMPLSQLIVEDTARTYKQITFLERKQPAASILPASISQKDVYTTAINHLYYYHFNQSMTGIAQCDKRSINPPLPVSQIISLPLLWHRNLLIRPLLAKETQGVALHSQHFGLASLTPIYFATSDSLDQLNQALQNPQDNSTHESYAIYETTAYKLIGLVHYSFVQRIRVAAAGKPVKTYHYCLVNSLGVDAGYQRRGLGTTLLSVAFIRAKQRDCKKIELTKTPVSSSFVINLFF